MPADSSDPVDDPPTSLGEAGTQTVSLAEYQSPRRPLATIVAIMLLGGAVAAVYGRALAAPFIYDDRISVVNNPSIQHLGPLFGDQDSPGPLRPPQNLSTAGRPLVNFSLALNYHFGWLNPVHYHAFNLVVHALSALLVWGILRGLFRLPRFAARFGAAADGLALCVALLFAVHTRCKSTR